MDRPLTHDEIMDLLGAFAVDAVEPDEAAAIERHLLSCPRCREEATELQQAAARLAAPRGAAPEGVWEGIAARIERPGAPAPAPPHLEPRVAGPRLTRSSLARRVAAALAAAAAVAAIAILGVQVAHLDHRLNRFESATSAQTLSGAAKAALLDPAAQRIVLHSTSGHSVPAAELVIQPSGAGYLFNSRLQPLPSRQTYQLWALSGGKAISLSVLGRYPTTAGFSVASVTTGSTYAVTVEQAGGSVAPTSAPVATT